MTCSIKTGRIQKNPSDIEFSFDEEICAKHNIQIISELLCAESQEKIK